MADTLKGGYTADYFYKLPLERFEIFMEFIDLKHYLAEEDIKKRFNKR